MLNKKAGFIGSLISIAIVIVFIYVCIKHPEILKEAGSWALDMLAKGWTFVMEKING